MCQTKPVGMQPPDYYVTGEPYWFYRYFTQTSDCQVDIIDISSFPALEKIEKEKLRFYVWQAIKAIPRLSKYDLIVSHGMQSGVVISLWRRLFKTRAKHIVFEIGSFNSAAESGTALRLMQYASKSIDGLIYHTSDQINYYEKCFPWLVSKAHFVRFGADSTYFGRNRTSETDPHEPYILCVGYRDRDWDTLVRAYATLYDQKPGDYAVPKLRMVGASKYCFPSEIESFLAQRNITNAIELIPYIKLEDLIEMISGADFSVLPLADYNYSFGQMSLLQQMALGQAVVVARVSSMKDYVRDYDTGVFYESGNSFDLAEKMFLLMKDETLRMRLGHNAADYVHNEYNEMDMAMAIEQVYIDVLRS